MDQKLTRGLVALGTPRRAMRLLVYFALWQGVRSQLLINEVADKANASDAGCAGSDWVELRNPTASPVPLAGLVLSDDHGLPYDKSLTLGGAGCPGSLGGGELLLLCKDGNASVGGASYDGCGFAFGIGGSDAVGLYQYNGTAGGEAAVVVDVTNGCCSGDATTSFGRPAGSNGSFVVLPARTPGLPNAGATLLGAVAMSPSRGWFSQPFNLSVTCEGAASIACTADGSDPRNASAVLAAQGGAALSLWVDPTDLFNGSRAWRAPAVTVRCVGAAPGAPQSSPTSHTYIFSEAVLDQGEFLEGDFAAGVFWTTAMENSSGFLSREGASRAEMLAALVSLPTVSIAMPHAHLFGPEGIHRGDNLEAPDLEHECSLELMYPPNVPRWTGFLGTQSPAGIRAQGGGGRWQRGAYDHKQSFGLRFRSRYGGSSKLRYPVFESAPLHASSAAGEFDKLILRSGHNKNWGATWDPENTVFTRDQFTRDLQIAMGGHGSHGTFVLLYLNGQFWCPMPNAPMPNAQFAVPSAQCPTAQCPTAQCPMPQCPMPNAQCPHIYQGAVQPGRAA